MRKVVLSGLLLTVMSGACDSQTPSGPGRVAVTQTTTSTTTSTIAPPTTALFVFSPASPRANQAVVFNAVASFATVGRTIVSYAWNFGDGGTATGTNTTASHTFTLDGTYNVTLTVTDSAGQTATVAQPVPVVGFLTTTTTTVPPISAAARYVNPSVPANLPTDMTLFFQLISGNSFRVQGIYNTSSGVRGRVEGTLVGAITPAVSGAFTGLMTAEVPVGAPTCTASRAFNGSVGPLLSWTGGATTTECAAQGSPLSFPSFTLLKSEAPPATTTIALGRAAR